MTNIEDYPFVLENRTSAVVYPKGSRPVFELAHSIGFVLNVSQLVDQPPNANFAVAPGHELRRATRPEVAAIKEVLTDFAAVTSWQAWQSRPVKESTKTSFPQIPEDQWRYFVIAFEGSNYTTAEIERTLCIAPFELKIAFTLLREAVRGKCCPGLMYHPARLFTQTHRAANGQLPFLEVNTAAVQTMVLLYNQLRAFDHELMNLKRLTEQVLDLDALPYESPLLF